MSLRDTINQDAYNVFMNTDDFAEVVTYHPGNGSSRSIKAVVQRDPITGYTENGTAVIPRCVVFVPNNSTLGISGDELDEGQDQIEMAIRDGEPPIRRTITVLLSHDHAMLELECR